jgi:hypothetical protein
MKTSVRFLVLPVGLSMLLALTGCNTVSVNSHQYVGVQPYPPSDPALIQILRKKPTRPHVQLGEVRAEPASEKVGVQKIETALRHAAAKMGADAIVIVFDRTEVTGALVSGSWHGGSIQRVTGRVIVGVAIKYTGEAGG